MRGKGGESAREQGRDLHERPRAVTAALLEPDTLPSRALQESERNAIASHAARSGLLASIAAGAISGALVLAANRLSPRFRSALGVSGKTALVVTPTAFTFFAKSHLTVAHATADPTGYLGRTTGEAPQRQEPLGKLQPWHRVANAVSSNPFKTIVGIAAPLYALIFYRESTHPSTANMLLSQRLIHTRVYGQAIAVLTTVSVMYVCECMKDGPYVAAPVAGAATLSPGDEVYEVEPRGASAGLLAPLVYVPLMPTLVILLRGRVRPETLQRVILGTIALGLAHAGSVMFTDSSVI